MQRTYTQQLEAESVSFFAPLMQQLNQTMSTARLILVVHGVKEGAETLSARSGTFALGHGIRARLKPSSEPCRERLGVTQPLRPHSRLGIVAGPERS